MLAWPRKGAHYVQFQIIIQNFLILDIKNAPSSLWLFRYDNLQIEFNFHKIIKGIVPKIMFLAPVIVLITLYLNALSKDLGEAASNLNGTAQNYSDHCCIPF